MATEGFAPAKINLTLHVTGRRADGYHLLDSLVAFADVGDHVEALWAMLHRGKSGESYNIGGMNETTNLHLVQQICDLVDEMRPSLGRDSRSLISFVADRLGHDRRYAINASKIEHELGWRPAHAFESGVRETVSWYLDHQDWVNMVREKNSYS